MVGRQVLWVGYFSPFLFLPSCVRNILLDNIARSHEYTFSVWKNAHNLELLIECIVDA